MSGYEFDTPDSYDSESPYLKEPGTYHMQVLDLQEGLNHNGKVIDGFSVTLGVLAGPNETKTANCSFFNPKEGGSENGNRISKQKIANFAIATNLLDPNAAGTGKRVAINLLAALNQQIVVRFAMREGSDKKEHLDIEYASIFHVDDPDTEKVEKSAKHLSLLPPGCRKSADFFKFKSRKKQEAPKPQTATAGAAAPDWSSL